MRRMLKPDTAITMTRGYCGRRPRGMLYALGSGQSYELMHECIDLSWRRFCRISWLVARPTPFKPRLALHVMGVCERQVNSSASVPNAV